MRIGTIMAGERGGKQGLESLCTYTPEKNCSSYSIFFIILQFPYLLLIFEKKTHLSDSASWTKDQSRHAESWHPQPQAASQHPRSWCWNSKLYFLSSLSQLQPSDPPSRPHCSTNSSPISSVTFWAICLTAPWYVSSPSGRQTSSGAVWGWGWG